jgi:hypothetical protein
LHVAPALHWFTFVEQQTFGAHCVPPQTTAVLLQLGGVVTTRLHVPGPVPSRLHWKPAWQVPRVPLVSQHSSSVGCAHSGVVEHFVVSVLQHAVAPQPPPPQLTVAPRQEGGGGGIFSQDPGPLPGLLQRYPFGQSVTEPLAEQHS